MYTHTIHKCANENFKWELTLSLDPCYGQKQRYVPEEFQISKTSPLKAKF